MENEQFFIRFAERKDCTGIFDLVQAFTAEFGQPPSRLSVEVLERDGFDEQIPLFRCLVAEDKEGSSLCGYALYSVIYSARAGKAIWLEDIYVCPDYRSKSLGKLLFTKVAQEAHNGNFCRMDFSVYSWNTAAKFYEKLGAVNITETEKWNLWRLDTTDITNLLKN